MSFNVTSSKSLHAEIVDESCILEFLEIFKKLFFHNLPSLEKSNNNSESIALQLSECQRVSLMLFDIIHPQLFVSEGDFIEFIEHVSLAIVERYELCGDTSFVF